MYTAEVDAEQLQRSDLSLPGGDTYSEAFAAESFNGQATSHIHAMNNHAVNVGNLNFTQTSRLIGNDIGKLVKLRRSFFLLMLSCFSD
jgi:hypothetical protein